MSVAISLNSPINTNLISHGKLKVLSSKRVPMHE